MCGPSCRCSTTSTLADKSGIAKELSTACEIAAPCSSHCNPTSLLRACCNECICHSSESILPCAHAAGGGALTHQPPLIPL